MTEPRRVESLGSRLLDLGQPQPSVWSRDKQAMEGAMTDSGSVTRELRPVVLSIVMFLLAVLFIVRYHVDRINLEIRRDIKELTLAVLELKEGLAKRS